MFSIKQVETVKHTEPKILMRRDNTPLPTQKPDYGNLGLQGEHTYAVSSSALAITVAGALATCLVGGMPFNLPERLILLYQERFPAETSVHSFGNTRQQSPKRPLYSDSPQGNCLVMFRVPVASANKAAICGISFLGKIDAIYGIFKSLAGPYHRNPVSTALVQGASREGIKTLTAPLYSVYAG